MNSTTYSKIFSFLQSGQKIQAIKAYREAFPNTGLREAKEAVDMAQVALGLGNVRSDVLSAVATLKQLKEIKANSPMDLHIKHRVTDLIEDVTEYIVGRL